MEKKKKEEAFLGRKWNLVVFSYFSCNDEVLIFYVHLDKKQLEKKKIESKFEGGKWLNISNKEKLAIFKDPTS